ncbi:MAG: hypothetical protein RIE24_26995 [Silicimonas sp.]
MKKPSKAAVSTLALVLALGFSADVGGGFVRAAFAAGDGSGGQGSGQGNQGGQGQGSQGSQSGQGNQGGSGSGQGGPDAGSDAKGPQAGNPAGSGSAGGRPIWAQEGIPEIELGRLSVARSPEQVLDRALAEANATLTPSMVSFYNQSLDAMIADLSLNWDTITIYDSPLQNLALFQDVLEDGDVILSGVDDGDPEKLLAVFLGVASDKVLPISEETVIAVTTILVKDLGTMIAIDPAAVAADAEAIRIAVLAGHG